MMKEDKPEYMTSLYGDVMVPKTHDRIVFRGAIDTLEAEILEAQLLSKECRQPWYDSALGEVLSLLRSIMRAEVTETELLPFSLFGLGAEDLHWQSQNIGEAFGLANFPIPDHNCSPLAVRLNYLRARIRETEILAIKTFDPLNPKISSGNEIITALNRFPALFGGCIAGA
ncbi:MAG: hypothetical protein FWF22_03705 [Treponema sp.]|nr:hypothetical protein [Treponema sp.]